MKKTLYRVTDAAPSHVCGQRVQAGDVLPLYPQVAEYERDLGHLATVSDETEAQPHDLAPAELPDLDPSEEAAHVQGEPDDAQG